MIIFNNNKQYETIAIYGEPITFQNARRDSLDIVIDASLITLEEAKVIWTDETVTNSLTILSNETNADGEVTTITNCYVDYTLPVELKVNTLNGTEVVHIKLAQKSSLEKAQEKQATDITNIEAALIELAELNAGGNE